MADLAKVKLLSGDKLETPELVAVHEYASTLI
jgi:hypothetical protein